MPPLALWYLPLRISRRALSQLGFFSSSMSTTLSSIGGRHVPSGNGYCCAVIARDFSSLGSVAGRTRNAPEFIIVAGSSSFTSLIMATGSRDTGSSPSIVPV